MANPLGREGPRWKDRLVGSLLGQLRLAAFLSVVVGFSAASTATLLIHQRALVRQHERQVELAIGPLLRQLPALVADPSSPRRRQAVAAALERSSRFDLLFWITLPDGSRLLSEGRFQPLSRQLAGRAETAWLSPAGPPDRRALPPGSRLPHASRVQRDSYRLVPLGEQEFLIHLHLATPQGLGLWVAEDLTTQVEFLSGLLAWILLAWAVCLALTLLAMSWMIRRIIRPLRDLNAQAASVTSSSLATSRLEVQRAPLEVQELATGYNNLLDRLSLAWEQQREFVRSVSHELRNPLTLIGGSLQRLLRRDTALVPESRRTLAMAEAETRRITRLLNDLLDLSRSDSGRLELVLQPVAVDEVLCTACDLARCQLGRPLELQLPPEATEQAITALAEADRLQQVVLNLIENADKYSPAGVPIVVQLVRESPAGLAIRVIDQGIGIAADDLPHIFDRFHRGANAARVQRGSGLGLSVVKLLVEAMGGRLAVESQIDRGSCFAIHLPAIGSDAPLSSARVPDPAR